MLVCSSAFGQEKAVLKYGTALGQQAVSQVSVNDAATSGVMVSIPHSGSFSVGYIGLGNGSGGTDWNTSDTFAGRLGADDSPTSLSLPAFTTVQGAIDAVPSIFAVTPAGGTLTVTGDVGVSGAASANSLTSTTTVAAGTDLTVGGNATVTLTATAADLVATDDLTVGDDADVVGDLTAGTVASDSTVVAGTTVTAGTGVTSTTGDIVATAGDLSATGGLVKLGDSSGVPALQIDDTTTNSEIPNLHIRKQGATTRSFIETYSSANATDGPRLILRRARGTIASPTDVNAGDTIGAIWFGGYDSGTSTFLNTAVLASSSVTAGGDDGNLEVFTRKAGTGTLALTIDNNQDAAFEEDVSVGGSLDVDGAADVAGTVTAQNVTVDDGGTMSAPAVAVRAEFVSGTIFADSLSSPQEFQLPDASGTLAIVSDIPGSANPSATVNGTAANGTAGTWMRSDAAPALADPFTPADGTQNVTGALTASGNVTGATLIAGAGSAAANSLEITGAGNPVGLFWQSSGIMGISTSGIERYRLSSAGIYQSAGTPTQTLGRSTNRWADLFSVDGDFSGNVDVAGALDVNGSADVAGSLYMGGSGNAAYIDGTLAIHKDANRHFFGRSLSDGVDVRSQIGYMRCGSTWIVRWTRVGSSTAEWARNFAPYVDNEPYLGTSSLRWASVYSYDGNFADDVTISDLLTTSRLSVSTSVNSSLIPDVDTRILGDSGARWGNVYSNSANVSGTATVGTLAADTAVTVTETKWRDYQAPSAVGVTDWTETASYLTSNSDGQVAVFPVDFEDGTVISRVRVKFAAGGEPDGVSVSLFRRDESGTTTSATTVGSGSDTGPAASTAVYTLDITDETVAANNSYWLQVDSIVVDTNVLLYAVGFETTTRSL